VAKGTIEEGMISVLAFKRSLSAGILDGGSGEILLGGSRLNRFMKDVESVTGRMGEGEAVTPAEEANGAIAAADAAAVPDPEAESAEAPIAPPSRTGADPWQALMKIGGQLFAALAAGNGSLPRSHRWIEHDPATGAQSLKIPLPAPEIAGQLADALSALADSLRR
jgi:hypothetical protein